MSSQKQIDANRANSRKSTGPRTAAGKAASCTNALKHGMRSRTIVMSHEGPALYADLYNRITQQFAPRDQHEQFLCKQMADARWHLDRLKFIETGLLEAPEIDTAEFDRNSRWQVRMENTYYKAHKQLMQLRKEQEAARAKATAGTEARAQAEPPSEDDADADAEPVEECLDWLDEETGARTQVAGPPE